MARVKNFRVGVYTYATTIAQPPDLAYTASMASKVSTMTPEQLSKMVTSKADSVWQQLGMLYPQLQRMPRPAVKYNKRLKTTAGRAFIDSKPPYFDLSNDLLWQYPDTVIEDTVPHELAHIAAYIVFGDCGHGKDWKSVMVAINRPPAVYHNMLNSRHEARKLQRITK